MLQDNLCFVKVASGDGVQRGSSSMGPKRSTLDPKLIPADHPQGTNLGSARHPAVAAYQESHPRRTLINFGPYILLQTLGEGEFGKVKLGVHKDYGEEVAIKLIRRGAIDDDVRRAKVEREIDVLKIVRHPHIVRLYDVIETEKYIGIVLDFAKGGELFDYILANKYLKEREASRIFAQLISGVNYLHEKKIVHRDLKLENLLLDKNRNVIITDFGFANRFQHRPDDLMATSCGSPCYAAPELVISEGLYVGSAVDVWSCGVILYAMLSGYLPFDDDPANPDGDNINLLYRYIVATPLTFPDYISVDARNLLSAMLVPDPGLRCDLGSVMAHAWLNEHQSLFNNNQSALEEMAQQQQSQKRQAARHNARSRSAVQEQGTLRRLAKLIDEREVQIPQKPVTDLDIASDYKSSNGRSNSGVPGPAVSVSHPGNLSSSSDPDNLLEAFRSNEDSEMRDIVDKERNWSCPLETTKEPPCRRNRHTIQLEYREELVQPLSHRDQSVSLGTDVPGKRTALRSDGPEVDDRVLSVPTILHSLSSAGITNLSQDAAAAVGVDSTQSRNARDQFRLDRLDSQVTEVVSAGRQASNSQAPLKSDASAKAVPRLEHARLISSQVGSRSSAVASADVNAVGATPIQQSMQSETHERKGSRVGRLESSTYAARRVMDWFRKRSQRQAPSSKGISPIEASGEIAHTANRLSVRNSRPISSFGASTGPFASEITGSMLKSPTSPLATQTQISETNNETRPYSLARPSLSRPDLHKDTAPIHRGLIDQNTLTTKHPEEIMSILEGVLTGMNISFKHESPFRLRCVHQGQQSSETTGQTTNDYKVSIIPLFRDVMTFKGIAGRPGGAPPARLDAKEPPHDSDIRFSIEITRLQNLAGLHSIDLKRIRGNAWSYKDIHQSIIERCEFSH